MWKKDEVLDWLAFWDKEKVQEYLCCSHRNIDYIEDITKKMHARGWDHTAIECRSKTKTMNHEYRCSVE